MSKEQLPRPVLLFPHWNTVTFYDGWMYILTHAASDTPPTRDYEPDDHCGRNYHHRYQHQQGYVFSAISQLPAIGSNAIPKAVIVRIARCFEHNGIDTVIVFAFLSPAINKMAMTTRLSAAKSVYAKTTTYQQFDLLQEHHTSHSNLVRRNLF